MNKNSKIIEKVQVVINFIPIIISFIVCITDFVSIFVTGSRKNDFVFEIILLDVTFLLTYILSINLKNNIKENNSIYITARLELEESLEELFDDADELYFVGISNDGILNFYNKEIIENAINKGTIFKFICIDPLSDAYKEVKANKTNNKRSATTEALDFYDNYLSAEAKAKIEIRLTKINLPFSMTVKKKKNIITSIKIDLYGIDINDRDRRSFIISSNDRKNIYFYENQFEKILEKSIPYKVSG